MPRGVFIYVQIHPDFSAQREMRHFFVYCMFKTHGCNQTMPWSQYKVKFFFVHVYYRSAVHSSGDIVVMTTCTEGATVATPTKESWQQSVVDVAPSLG